MFSSSSHNYFLSNYAAHYYVLFACDEIAKLFIIHPLDYHLMTNENTTLNVNDV